ncbi:MAG: serine/threonine protein kinase, CMGC, CDC2/CDK sub [Geoglossum simile]|nr:MAG: serine/threonine protein kinase, CMGC, CDC2/CDK sub [Geoglossum simile]
MSTAQPAGAPAGSTPQSGTQSSPSDKPQASRRSLEMDEHGHPRFQGCSKIGDYEILGKLGEGTFGEVHKARSRKTKVIVALKKILMHNEKDGFPITALREIKLLKMLCHPNILRLEEMAIERSKGTTHYYVTEKAPDSIAGDGRKKATMYMVTPYMDHDLSGLLENPNVTFTEPQIKCYLLQLLEGLRYLHHNHILHRDMKGMSISMILCDPGADGHLIAANLLINNRGILQIADFGLARHYDEQVPQAGRGGGVAKRDYTNLVVTRWYRPPELLLGLRKYTTAIDMWGVGCVFGEMFVRRPILAGKSDVNQLQMIFELVGTPTEETMPGWNELPGCEGVKDFKPQPGNLAQQFRAQGSSAISLLSDLMKLDWRKRINAIDALKHPYFGNNPRPARPEDIPRFEDSHELDRRKFRGQKAALPPAPAGGTVGMGQSGGWTGGGGPTAGGGPWSNGAGPPGRRAPGGWPGGAGSASYGPGEGPPQPSHDSRVPSHRGFARSGHGGPPDHRPPWSRGAQHDGRHPPPPPPPPPMNQAWGGSGMDGGRERSSYRAPPGGTGSRMDSYIPSYSAGSEGARSRDDKYDRNRGGGERREYGARNSGRDRSRSPSRGKDRDRATHRERDRDLYRR